MKIVNLMLLLLVLALLCGCAAPERIAKSVLVTSEPPGATVYLDGDRVGETPLKIETFFTWNDEKIYASLLRRIIQVRKDGYESQTRDLYPVDMPNVQFLLNRENLRPGGHEVR